MKRAITVGVIAMALACAGPSVTLAQQDQTQAQREAVQKANVARLGQFLAANGQTVHITFHQSEKVFSNYAGELKQGLKYCDSLEVVINAAEDNTIRVLVYPHVDGHYLNIDKARDSTDLMKQMLHFNNDNFMYWGADKDNDVFARYTITLESGFPDEAMKVVLYSIVSNDLYAQQLSYFM
jgi:hypothetical protein